MYVCENCKSSNVSHKCWVNMNTGQIIEAAEFDDTYCEDCCKFCTIIEMEKIMEENLRCPHCGETDIDQFIEEGECRNDCETLGFECECGTYYCSTCYEYF